MFIYSDKNIVSRQSQRALYVDYFITVAISNNISMYLYICIYLYLYLYLFIYVYVYVYLYMYMYIYIFNSKSDFGERLKC